MEFEYDKLLKKAIESKPKDSDAIKRFEIPKVSSEIQGNKTLLKNFNEITNTLRRDPKHLSKFFLKQLATPGNIQGNILILQRKVPGSMLQSKLEQYVRDFIYCKECGKPDTKLVKEDRVTYMKCEACGARFPVSNV